jgi:hypothetical protein
MEKCKNLSPDENDKKCKTSSPDENDKKQWNYESFSVIFTAAIAVIFDVTVKIEPDI